MAGIGGDPQICYRCQKGPSYHGGHQRQDPKCLLHGCTSTKAKDIQEDLKQRQIEQAVLKALEDSHNVQPNPDAKGVTSSTTTSSSTRPSPPPPPPPSATEVKPRQRRRRRTKAEASQSRPPKDVNDEEDLPDALIADPLNELFGIHTNKGEIPPGADQRSPRTPVRYFASPPAELTPPPLPVTSSSSYSPVQNTSKLTEDTSAPKPKPEWVLPQLSKAKTSRIIRGLDPIEAGAARAIPTTSATTPSTPTERLKTHLQATVTTRDATAGTSPDTTNPFADDKDNNQGLQDNLEAGSFSSTLGAATTTMNTSDAVLHSREPQHDACLPSSDGECPDTY